MFLQNPWKDIPTVCICICVFFLSAWEDEQWFYANARNVRTIESLPNYFEFSF